MESLEEKFSESSNLRNNDSEFETELHEVLSNLLADPLVTEFIPKFKQQLIKFINETKVKNYDTLIEILPSLMKYALQLYSYNSLMDNANGSKDYFEFVTLLLLEYLKGKFLKQEIIGNVAEQMIIDLILTYLYRNEGAIMDLLLQLTFWVENSLEKSHIHLENLFKLTSDLFLTLIVHNRVYLEAQYTNLSLLNYIRALFLFKVLKHLETECNAAKASLEVQIEDRIDSKIEQLVLNVLPIHPQLESVLGLLGRVFPESKVSLFRSKMRGFLITYDYYLFERIAGLLDFEQQHAPCIDLKGNINLKLMQQKKVRYNNCCKILSEFSDPVLRKFVPEKCLNTKDFPKQHNWSQKFTRHVPVMNKNRTNESKNRISFNREEQLFITSNDNVPVLCVHRDLESGRMAHLHRFVEVALKNSTQADVSMNHAKKRLSPPQEELIDKENPSCFINSVRQLPVVGSRPEVEKLHRREIVTELQDSNLNKSCGIFGKSFNSSLACVSLKPDAMLFSTLTDIVIPKSTSTNIVIPKVEEPEVSRLVDKIEKCKLDEKKVIIIKPSKINLEKSNCLRRINPPNPWSNSKWVDRPGRCSKNNKSACTSSTTQSNLSSSSKMRYRIRPRSTRELFNVDCALPNDKKVKESNNQTNSQQLPSIFNKNELFPKLNNKPSNSISETSKESVSNLKDVNPTACIHTELPLENIHLNTGTTSSLNGLTLKTSKQPINANLPEKQQNNLHIVDQEQQEHPLQLLTSNDKRSSDNTVGVVVEEVESCKLAQETSDLNVDLLPVAGNWPLFLDHDYANKQTSSHDQLQITISPNKESQVSSTSSTDSQVCISDTTNTSSISNDKTNEQISSENQVGKLNTTSISNNQENEESPCTSEEKNQLFQVSKESLESSCKSYESHVNLMSTMLDTSSVSSMENIINEIVQVAENMEKTDARPSELTPYCTSTLLATNKYAAIEPDEMVAHFSGRTIGNEKLNHKNSNINLEMKELCEKEDSSQKETKTSEPASCDNFEQTNELDRPVPQVLDNEVVSKAHASKKNQPTNVADPTTRESPLYTCTSEIEINYEKNAQEGDFREDLNKTVDDTITKKSNQNKDLKEKTYSFNVTNKSHDLRSEVSSDEENNETIDPSLFEELTEAPFTMKQHSLGMKIDEKTLNTNTSKNHRFEQKSEKKMEPRMVSGEYEIENEKRKTPQPDKLFDMQIVKPKDLKTYTINKNKLRRKNSKKRLQKKSLNTSKMTDKRLENMSNTTQVIVPEDHSIPLSPQESCSFTEGSVGGNVINNVFNDIVQSDCENSTVNCDSVQEDLVLKDSGNKDQAQETETINNLLVSMTNEENLNSNQNLSSTELVVQNEFCKQNDNVLQKSDLVSKDIDQQEMLNECTAENEHIFSLVEDPNKSLCFNLSGNSRCFDVDKEKEQNGKEMSNNPNSLSNTSKLIFKNVEILDMSIVESNKMEFKGSQVDKVKNNNDDPNISSIFELSNTSSVKNIFEKTSNLREKASRKFLDEFSNEVKNNVRRNKRKSSSGNFISKADISQKLRRLSAVTSEKMSLSTLVKNKNEKCMTQKELPLASPQVVSNTDITQSKSKSSTSSSLENFDNYLSFKQRRSSFVSSNLSSSVKTAKKKIKNLNSKVHPVDAKNCSSTMDVHKKEMKHIDLNNDPPQKIILNNYLKTNTELEPLKNFTQPTEVVENSADSNEDIPLAKRINSSMLSSPVVLNLSSENVCTSNQETDNDRPKKKSVEINNSSFVTDKSADESNDPNTSLVFSFSKSVDTSFLKWPDQSDLIFANKRKYETTAQKPSKHAVVSPGTSTNLINLSERTPFSKNTFKNIKQIHQQKTKEQSSTDRMEINSNEVESNRSIALSAKSIEVTAEIHNEPNEISPSKVSKNNESKTCNENDYKVRHCDITIRGNDQLNASGTALYNKKINVVTEENSNIELYKIACEKHTVKKTWKKTAKICEEIRQEIDQEGVRKLSVKNKGKKSFQENPKKLQQLKKSLSTEKSLPGPSVEKSDCDEEKITPPKHSIGSTFANEEKINNFLFEHSRKRKRKKNELLDSLNVSIGLDEQMRSILSSSKKSAKTNEFFRLNSQYKSKDNGCQKKLNTCTDSKPNSRISIKLKCNSSAENKAHKKYKSYIIQENSVSINDTASNDIQDLVVETSKDIKKKSADSDIIPLLTFETFDRSENEEDTIFYSNLNKNQEKDRRTSTLSTPRNSVDDHSEDETIETIEKFISTSTKESTENDSVLKVLNVCHSNLNKGVTKQIDGTCRNVETKQSVETSSLVNSSVITAIDSYLKDDHLDSSNSKRGIRQQASETCNTTERKQSAETSAVVKSSVPTAFDSYLENDHLDSPKTKKGIITDSNVDNDITQQNNENCTNAKQSVETSSVVNASAPTEFDSYLDDGHSSNLEKDTSQHSDGIRNNEKTKQSVEANTAVTSSVSTAFDSYFKDHLDSPKDVVSDLEIHPAPQIRDVNFNSNQFNCNIVEDAILTPLEQNNSDLEASTESYASSEWNISPDSSMPTYLSYYEYSHTIECATIVKHVPSNDITVATISETHCDKRTSCDTTSSDTSIVLERKEKDPSEFDKATVQDMNKTSDSALDSEALSVFFSNFKASKEIEMSEKTPSKNEVHLHSQTKLNESNKLQANYPKTHATIIHLAKSSMLEKSRNENTTSQSSCSKKNIAKKQKTSGSSNYYSPAVDNGQKGHSLFNLADLKSSDIVQADNSISESDTFPMFLCDVNDKIVQNEFINSAALLGADDKLFEESSSSEVSCNENLNLIIASLSDDTNSSDTTKRKCEKGIQKQGCETKTVECKTETKSLPNNWGKNSNTLENNFTVDGANLTNSRILFDIQLGLEVMDNSELRIVKSSVRPKSSNFMENCYNQDKKNVKLEQGIPSSLSLYGDPNIKVSNAHEQYQQSYSQYHHPHQQSHLVQRFQQNQQKHLYNFHQKQRLQDQEQLDHRQHRQRQYQEHEEKNNIHHHQQKNQNYYQSEQNELQSVKQHKSHSNENPWVVNYDQTNAQWNRSETQCQQNGTSCKQQLGIRKITHNPSSTEIHQYHTVNQSKQVDQKPPVEINKSNQSSVGERNNCSYTQQPYMNFVHQKSHPQIYNTALNPSVSPTKSTVTYSPTRFSVSNCNTHPFVTPPSRTFSCSKNQRVVREQSLLKTVHRKKLLEKQIVKSHPQETMPATNQPSPAMSADAQYPSSEGRDNIVINPPALRTQSIIMKTNNQNFPIDQTGNVTQQSQHQTKIADSEARISHHNKMVSSESCPSNRIEDNTPNIGPNVSSDHTIGPFITEHTFTTDYNGMYGSSDVVPYVASVDCEGSLTDVDLIQNYQNMNNVGALYYYEPMTYENRSSVLDIPILPANRMMSIAEVLANPDCNPELQNKLKTISSSK